MNNQPILSIIVPVYGVEKYLDQCVQSLVNQAERNIEIILVDDGSPDRCPEMCDNYAKSDSRIRVIHKQNGGQGYARNSGLDIATGEYVTFVDSDDYVAGDTYQYLLNRHASSQYDAIYFQFQKFTDPSSPSEQKELPWKHIRVREIDALKLDIISPASHVRKEHTVPCTIWNVLYRREFLEQHHIRFHSEREFSTGEDLIFNLDFLSVATSVCMDSSVLYFYRYNPYSTTHTVSLERFKKYAKFDTFLRESRQRWNLPDEAETRISRLTIGNFRSVFQLVLSSSENRHRKRDIFRQAVGNQTLQDALRTYPCPDYALYQRLFAIAMRWKSYWLASLLTYVKSHSQHAHS